jgi:hypothetical protein
MLKLGFKLPLFVYVLIIPVLTFHILSIFFVFSYSRKHAEIQVILDELDYVADSNKDDVLGERTVKTDLKKDPRVANLKVFFRKHNSDLYEHTEYIVSISDKYGLDYRLLPAIAMQESTLCRNIPVNSHNCWGWGIYGDKVTRFGSYEEAIETVAKGLKKNYIDHGLVSVEQIMSKYNPSSPNGSWARGVGFIMDSIHF